MLWFRYELPAEGSCAPSLVSSVTVQKGHKTNLVGHWVITTLARDECWSLGLGYFPGDQIVIREWAKLSTLLFPCDASVRLGYHPDALAEMHTSCFILSSYLPTS